MSNSNFVNDFDKIDSVILRVEDFNHINIPPKKQILSPWLAEQSMVLISGSRGSGKTWFTATIAHCITRGVQYGPWKVVNPASCLYVDGELILQDLQDRFKILNAMNKEPERAPLYIYNDHFANLQGLPKAHMANPEWQEALRDLMIEKEIKVAIFDNIASLSPGLDENSKSAWDPVNQWLLNLRYGGITSILLHHLGKGGSQRGTSGREDSLDISILLEKTGRPEEVKFILKFTKCRIAYSDTPLVQNAELTFDQSDECPKWIYSVVREKTRIQVLAMLGKGMEQGDIAKGLEISKSYVSRIRTQAIRDQYLDADGKLTDRGRAHIASMS